MANTIRYTISETALGDTLVAYSDRGICALFMDSDREHMVAELSKAFPEHQLQEDASDPLALAAKVGQVIADPKVDIEVPLDMHGSTFQKRVWQALCAIPPGQTRSYTQVAETLAMPKGARAVARACATNLISVLVPCHRVVGKKGALSGYRWGLSRKSKLLALEGAR